MEDLMTIPCGTHQAKRFWLKQYDRDAHEHEAGPSNRRLAKRSYAPRLTRRRLREYSLALARVLASEEQAIAAPITLEQRFREQAYIWQRDTAHLSSPLQRMMHPSYQAILGMGAEHKKDIVRLMLWDMRDNRRDWLLALSYLTQENPVNPKDAGKTDKLIQAWMKWGKEQGLMHT